jgi:uncharacterized protein (TIGR03437 family)
MLAKPQIVLILALVTSVSAQVSVPTYQYDVSRAGANQNEVALTPSNVNANQFGKLFSYPVDGYVYAQPLYLPNVNIAGRGMHNVGFVVTEHDSVYAFDADGPGDPAGGPLWQVSFLGPGVTTVPAADTGCDQIIPEIGITGTPVIDPNSGTLYLVAMTKENGSYVHRLHALDVTSGQEQPGSPVVIQASSPGTGDGGKTDVLIPKNYKQRPGLLLLNGVVYTGWSSHCDGGRYHGWLIGYDAKSLAQVSVYNTTPNGSLGSLWAGGAAPAADAASNIYVVSANGTFDRASGGPDLGESYIKLGSGGGLPVLDYFTPFNQKALNDGDVDTGSAGVALLGDEAGSAAHPHLMAGAGKEGRIYLLDRDHLGGYQSSSDSQIVQSIPGATSGLFGNPAYFNNTVYFCGSGDGVEAFPVSNAQLATKPASRSPLPYGYPGCVPTISANGTSNGIVWTVESGLVLHAYDAGNLGNELYNTAQNPARDALDSYVKYSVPTVVNGKLYVATQTALTAYALLPAAGGSLGISSAASGNPGAIAPGAIVSIYGQGLATTTTLAPGYPLPGATVGGASVTMNGWPAPIFFASPTQLNVQVPFEVSGAATVSVLVNGAPVNSGNITVQAAGPGIFQIGQGRAAALNQDNSVNSSTNSAAAGSTLSLYATGLGAVVPAVATGAAAGANPLSNSKLRVTATIGGQSATVQYAGIAPGYAGLDQVNVVVPNLTPGDYPVQISVGAATSNSATVSVH